MKLDDNDRRILYELSSDARQSFAHIGKTVGLSKEVVTYRVKNLIGKKAINRFYTELNASKLNYQMYTAHIKFQNLTEEIESEIFAFFENLPSATWVVTCSGAWDVICSVNAKNIVEYNTVLVQFLNRFSKYVLSKEIITNIAHHNYERKWLLADVEEKNKAQDKTPGKRTLIGGEITEAGLDLADQIILSALAHNAREPLTSIVQMCKLSGIVVTPNTIRYRVKELERKGMITAYRVSLNLSSFEREYCKAFIYFHQKTENNEHDLIEFCEKHPDIVSVTQCVGSWDFEIDFEVENIHVFHEVMRLIRHEFTFVKSYDTVIVTKENFCTYPSPLKN